MRIVRRLLYLVGIALLVVWSEAAVHGFRGGICLTMARRCPSGAPALSCPLVAWLVPLGLVLLAAGWVSLTVLGRPSMDGDTPGSSDADLGHESVGITGH